MKSLRRMSLLFCVLFCQVAVAAMTPTQGAKGTKTTEKIILDKQEPENFERVDDTDEPEEEKVEEKVKEKLQKKGLINKFFSWIGSIGSSDKKEKEEKKTSAKKVDDEDAEEDDSTGESDDESDQTDEEADGDEKTDEEDELFIAEPKPKLTKAEQKAQAEEKRKEMLKTKAGFDAERKKILDAKKSYLFSLETRSLEAFTYYMIEELKLLKVHEQTIKGKVDSDIEKHLNRFVNIFKALKNETDAKTLKFEAYEWIMGLKEKYMKEIFGATVKERFEVQQEEQQLRALQERIAKHRRQPVGVSLSPGARPPLRGVNPSTPVSPIGARQRAVTFADEIPAGVEARLGTKRVAGK